MGKPAENDAVAGLPMVPPNNAPPAGEIDDF